MADKVLPAIPKNIRFPQDLLELISNKAKKEGKTFTEIVIERLNLTFVEDWDYTCKMIKLANRKRDKWEQFKVDQKKIRLKQIMKRRIEKLDIEETKRKQKDHADVNKYSIVLNMVTCIQRHMDEEMPIWINDEDPDDWYSMATSPGIEYRKLEYGKLTDSLNDFYIEHIHLLK